MSDEPRNRSKSPTDSEVEVDIVAPDGSFSLEGSLSSQNNSSITATPRDVSSSSSSSTTTTATTTTVAVATNGTLNDLPLSPALMQSLGDRSYDKRKNAAMEIENLVKSLSEQENTQRVNAIIEMLGQDFACSTNANHRKGGLIGLAAITIGLMNEAHDYLNQLLPPVLHCFDDPESRVRYYACESLYNIAKVARGHILQYFNQVFDGLCKLFADVDVDVKNGANLLDRLLKDIVTESDSFDIDVFIPLLPKYIQMTNPYIRQLLVGWITVLDSVPDIDMLDWLPGKKHEAADSALAEFLREIKQAEYVDFGPMINILVGQCHSKERFNRLTAVTWVHEFVELGGTTSKLTRFYADVMDAILSCISDSEHEIRQVAERANTDLRALVQSTKEDLDYVPLMQKLQVELLSDDVATRLAALQWIAMLLDKSQAKKPLEEQIDVLLPVLLRMLSDVSDSVVLLALEVLAHISKNDKHFQLVLRDIVLLFNEDRALLETYGSMIIRKLCVLLDAKSIYMILAKVIQESEDPEFASTMVQTLNLILLTANELTDLRSILKRSFRKNAAADDVEVFKTLFEAWSHNPIATFSFCLLAQAYDLSSALVMKFADIDITVGFLMQLDNLVQLLESPIFIHMRLQMLESEKDHHAPLMKSLYGLLMLLPQSHAFKTLRDRLVCVTSVATAVSKRDRDVSKATAQAHQKLLERFETIQAKHVDAKRKAFDMEI